MKKNIIVFGSSRGIGAELVKHFDQLGHHVYGVSRHTSSHCQWIEGDISHAEGIDAVCSAICQAIGEQPIDAIVFSAGVWEDQGFTADFSFLETRDEETRHIMSVNTVAPIEITKRLVSNLSLSDNPRAIYFGAMSGVEQRASDQVAYSASKFALRGAIQGLRLALSDYSIGLSVINPANVATEEVLDDIKTGAFKQQTPIPMSDVISTVDWLLSLSNAVEVGDVNLMQRCQRNQ